MSAAQILNHSFFNAGNAAPPARLAEVVWVAEGLDLGSEANLHYAADDPPAEDDPSPEISKGVGASGPWI